MSRLFVDVTPLRTRRDFRLLFSSQFVSLLGSNVTLVAIPFQVYRDTHSSLWVGAASLFQLPFLIGGSLWGGAAGDRGDRRQLMITVALVQALLSAALGVNAWWTHGPLWTVLLLAALAAGAGGFAGPLRSSVIPRLVAPDELVAAYGLNQVMMNVSLVAGPSLAGLLLAGFGLSWCYFVDAATFVVIAVASVFFRSIPPNETTAITSLRASIAQGIAYVRSHRIAQSVYLIDLNAMVFGLPRALFPAVALTEYHGGPRLLGLLYAAPGVGAIVMAFLTGWLARVTRQGRLVVLVVVAWGVAMALFGLVHVATIGLLCLAVAGAMDVISTVLRNTILQNAITDDMRSRVSSIQIAVVTGGPRLGDLESGLVARVAGTSFSIVSGGVACVLGAALLVARRPEFWRQRSLAQAD